MGNRCGKEEYTQQLDTELEELRCKRREADMAASRQEFKDKQGDSAGAVWDELAKSVTGPVQDHVAKANLP